MNSSSFQSRITCRLCGRKKLIPILNLGNQPLANSLSSDFKEQSEVFPLVLLQCETCSLLQLSVDVNPSILFTNYLWVTGTSQMAREWSLYVKKLIEKEISTLTNRFSVCEIASNDGTFLKPFMASGHVVLGIEPAENLASIANKSGIPTENMFLSKSSALQIELKYGKFDILIARNVLAHVPEPRDLIEGIVNLTKSGGIIYLEFHNADSLYNELQYDAIYHEHYSYFSLKNIERLCDDLGISIVKVIKSPIGGGNLGVLLGKGFSRRSPDSKQKNDDMDANLDWKDWSQQVFEHKTKLETLLNMQHGMGIVFGASARGSTLINFCSKVETLLPYIVDNNELKHGKYSPGRQMEIIPVQEGLRLLPNYIFCLSWNFRDEVENQLKHLNFRGPIIYPFPKPVERVIND